MPETPEKAESEAASLTAFEIDAEFGKLKNRHVAGNRLDHDGKANDVRFCHCDIFAHFLLIDYLLYIRDFVLFFVFCRM